MEKELERGGEQVEREVGGWLKGVSGGRYARDGCRTDHACNCCTECNYCISKACTVAKVCPSRLSMSSFIFHQNQALPHAHIPHQNLSRPHSTQNPIATTFPYWRAAVAAHFTLIHLGGRLSAEGGVNIGRGRDLGGGG